MKYRQQDESFDGKIKRIAGTLCDGPEHQYALEDVLGEMRFLPAGRVQSAIGSARITTAYSCFMCPPHNAIHAIFHQPTNKAVVGCGDTSGSNR